MTDVRHLDIVQLAREFGKIEYRLGLGAGHEAESLHDRRDALMQEAVRRRDEQISPQPTTVITETPQDE